MKQADLGDTRLSAALLGLTYLNLAFVKIGVRAAESEWPWRRLCALTALRQLHMRDTSIRDVGADALALRISALAELRALDISDCEITSMGALGREIFRLPCLELLECTQYVRGWGTCTPFVVSAEAKARGIRVF